MNPADAATGALAIAQGFEKLGIIGVLFFVGALTTTAAFYFRKALVKAHEQITTLKQMLVIVRSAADAAGVKYDFKQIAELERELGGH